MKVISLLSWEPAAQVNPLYFMRFQVWISRLSEKSIFSGIELTKKNIDELALFRRYNCGFVFQQIYLVDSMSVFDNVMAAGLLVNKNKKEVVQKAKEILKAVDIEEELWG